MNLLNDYIEGRLGGVDRVLYKAAVLEIDHIGGKLAGPLTNPARRSSEPPNPKGSIVARVITDAADTYTDDDNLPVFWPMFPYDLMPVKESEHVYVIFEDSEQHHGLWLTRIPDPKEIHNLNITPGTKRFTSDSANGLKADSAEAEKAVQDLDESPGTIRVTADFKQEASDVPEFNSRVGDRIIHGSNNSTIILSRDRVNTTDSGDEAKAGSIDIVAGRVGDDVNMIDDAARVYVSMATAGDDNFATPGDALTDTENEGNPSYVIAKADQVRLIARQGMKIVVESGPTSITIESDGKVTLDTVEEIKAITTADFVVEAANVKLDASEKTFIGSADASHSLVRADNLKTYLDSVFDVYNAMVVDVAGVPALGVANSAVASAVKAIPVSTIKIIKDECAP